MKYKASNVNTNVNILNGQLKFWGLILFALLFHGASVYAQSDTLGIFTQHQDIGHPKNAGDAQYDKVTHTYSLSGSGYNIWFKRDEFQYLYKVVKGDFTATANFEFKGEKGNAHRKIGWMLRANTNEGSIHLSAVEHGDGLTVLQWRSKEGANMLDPQEEIFFPEKTFEVVQLQRIGKRVIMRVGHVGEPLKTVGSHVMPGMPGSALLGVFICSHDPEVTEKAIVWDVHLDGAPSK
jgi:TolB protein